MNGNRTQNPLKADRKNQKKDKSDEKLKAKLKKKLQQVKESDSPVQENVQMKTKMPTLISAKRTYAKPKPKPKVFKFDNDETSTSNNKNDKQSESKPSTLQHQKQKAKLAKNQKQPAHLEANKMTKNNESKTVTAKKKKKEPAIGKPNGKKQQKNKSNQKLAPTKPSKRQLDEIKTTIAKKRMKTVNGFVEIDANDQEAIQLVEKKLGKKKSKLEQIKKKHEDVGPPVIVHKISEKALHSETNSDSEDDSYIDKFFHKSDEEFDENRVYSQDEIESKKVNGFLSKGSEDGSSSDDNASSDDGQILKGNTTKTVRSFKSAGKEQVELTQNKHQSDDDSVDSAEFDGSHELSYNDYSDISLGSEVQSDENEMNYGSSFESGSDKEGAYYQDYGVGEYSDIEEDSDDDDSDMEEDSDDDDDSDIEEDSDDDYSYSDGSDYSNENDQSDESSDTYEHFMHGKNHDSDDDHEYTDEAYDDVRIPQGTAITYSVQDLRINVFKNDNRSRIIEIPKLDTEDDECPALVPIEMKKKELENIEKLKVHREQTKIEAMKTQAERRKSEYEKRVKDYYNMDANQEMNIHIDAKNQSALHFDDSNDSNDICEPAVIRVPMKMAKTLSILPDLENDEAIVMNDTLSTLPFPEVKPEQCIIGTIIDGSDTDDMIEENSLSNRSIESESETVQVQEMKPASGLDSSVVPNSEQIANECSEEFVSPNVPLSKAAQIIKGKPKFFNSLNSRHVLLLLRNIIYFHGSLHVKLIAGNATVFGYELQPNQMVTVHSPKCHSLIFMIPNPNKKTKHDLSCLNELKNDFFQQDLKFLSEEFDGSTDAIIMLERDRDNKGVNMIERYMRETMFPNVNAFNNESPHYSSEFVLHCKFSYRPKHGLVLNNEWSSVNVKSNTKLITIGGKCVGKSTFVRYMINSNFTTFRKFLFIDLDIGQPELFVPQTLSATVLCEPVLGPGYLRNIKPVKSVLFGDINVLPDPIKYLRCVIEIAKFCTSNAEYRNIPWIINTMGYSRGFGNEIMACILKIFQPTDLVQVQSRSNLDNFDRFIDAHFVNTFKFNVFEEEMQSIYQNCNFKTHIFDAICNDDNGKRKQIDFTAKDFRYTNILANLGNCLKCNSDWLTSVKPFEASLNDLQIIICSGEEVKESQYLDILNANLVYLCQTRDKNTADIADCYGIGIVRSVDVATNKIYLLSTIPLNELCNVNALAIGAIPLPSAVFLNQHSQIHGNVPYVYNTDNFVGSKQVAQHIFRSETNRKNKQIELMHD